ncbi:type II toxin-antitoxin system RelE/ParE family toxin [Inquilinus sp. YAF38]|uniref:type II toxin-antitoxin system RelE/ParE family toxin n=1 Tax=Inquilinus sp. YAF38 TaxID=3233084 RepID=UPI003F92D77E
MAGTHRVVFSPEARDDLLRLYLFIAERSGEARALVYVERIEAWCRGLATFPERGRRRDDLLPGLRVAGFESRVAIAFHIAPGLVTLDRILYGGRDLDALIEQPD